MESVWALMVKSELCLPSIFMHATTPAFDVRSGLV